MSLLPLYLIVILMIAIGSFPSVFLGLLVKPLSLFTGIQDKAYIPFSGDSLSTIQPVSLATWGLILLVGCILLLRRLLTGKPAPAVFPTWGCGYVAPDARLQYTGSSFVRTYNKLFRSVLLSYRHKRDVEGIFPIAGEYVTHPYDKLESILIDRPLKAYKSVMSRFLFLQNGNLQIYILYGIVFIGLVICIPLLYENIMAFYDFLKQL